jgi:hypothetical protein
LFYYPVEKKEKKEDAWLHFDWISSSSLLFFSFSEFDTSSSFFFLLFTGGLFHLVGRQVMP